ncbi:hypothetical protein BC751_2293 [Cecembia calidifontis]|uniref:Uncharacterized protein n=1 Tax=Cecembia calidifontis TaxID=1187080 RepID=A0A4Q7P983_9BACT|nr:hypothetical protein BC751_2293 [Cecembia calidifontis]
MADLVKSTAHIRVIRVIRGQENLVHELHIFPRKDGFLENKVRK